MTRRTERYLPVLIGSDHKYLMGQVIIDEDPGKTTVTIVAVGKEADILAGFLTAAEPIALSFAGIPVQPHKNTKE